GDERHTRSVPAGHGRDHSSFGRYLRLRIRGGQRTPENRLCIITLLVSGKAATCSNSFAVPVLFSRPASAKYQVEPGTAPWLSGSSILAILVRGSYSVEVTSSPSSSRIIASMNLTVVSNGWWVSLGETLVSSRPTSTSPMLSIVASSFKTR